MNGVLIAVLVMVVATTSNHLGLPQAIGKTMMKVLSCHKCLTFWLCMLMLIAYGQPLDLTVLLSLSMAYLSNWFALLLVELQKLYNWLWERLNKS